MSYDDMPQKQARIEALREEKGRLQKVSTADSAGRGGELQYQRCRKSS